MSNPPPSKNRQNQDAATMSRSRPSTSEEVEARARRPKTSGPDAADDAVGARGTPDPGRQTGDPLDQSAQATDEDVAERATPGRSRLSEGDD